LVQAIAARRGYGQATSPTFALQHVYGDDLFHYDLYRIDFEELAALGLIEGFEMSGWHLVEWMNDELKALVQAAGWPLWEVTIVPHEKGREYRIERING
jgi:tRNA threonylcarbamoyladenosine biosynthesis protein TsaE